jgi:hypothetical protein
MTAALFIAILLAMAGGTLVMARRYLPSRGFLLVALGLPTWLAYVGLLSALGVIRDTSLRPPGILYVFGPVILFMVLFAVRSKAGGALAQRIPLALLMGAQVFRVAVEVGIHRLSAEGLVPALMTFEGGNVDIAIGLSAPVVAWLWATGRLGTKAALGWNVIGLIALANVATRAVLTAPGPTQLIQGVVPNLAIGMFPYTYLAGFFAPSAVFLHILSIRALRSMPRVKSFEGQAGNASGRGA